MINVRSIRKLTNNDGLTLRAGRIIRYKTGWQVATEGSSVLLPKKLCVPSNPMMVTVAFGWKMACIMSTAPSV